ncbi:hypothetical protein L7F22_053406 [Adiantum nelumboides]|nr:hypothetical protein [Adiantum nelumboides]
MLCESLCRDRRSQLRLAMPSGPCCRRSLRSRSPFLKSLVISIVVVGTALIALLLLLVWFVKSRKSSRSVDIQTHSPDPTHGSLRKLQKYSYKELKKATNRFDETQKLGKGGYGVVYRGLLRNGEEVAVKKLVLSSLQGEREFQNELSICRRLESRYVVKLLGFATHGDKVRLLVYECMQNRSLQEALLEKHTSVHLNWESRFSIILDIARALAYLHLECQPPVVHGDVKPSNVLLDEHFRAYLADFGLARMKVEDQRLDQGPEMSKSEVVKMEIGTPESSEISKCKSFDVLLEDGKQSKLLDERVLASFCDHSLPSSYLGSPHSGVRFSSDLREVEIVGSTSATPSKHQVDKSPTEKLYLTADHSLTSNYQADPSPTEKIFPTADISKQNADSLNHLAETVSTDHVITSFPHQQAQKPLNKDNWWWKQENSGELKVKDYVMEWMRSELSADENQRGVDSRQNCGKLQAAAVVEGIKEAAEKKKEIQEQKKRRAKAVEEESQKEIDQAKRKERAKAARGMGRKGREWWKDEYFAELSKKGVRTNGSNKVAIGKGNRGLLPASIDRFRLKDVTGSNSWRLRGESVGETAASDDLSSTTTSMRGTVCYVAPEFGGVGVLSEASDIYSFGVLLLVIISGRRPIEITASANEATRIVSSVGSSPTVKRFERANLITWARNLAYSGNVFDLVDDRLHGSYSRDQAQLCISLALLCIRRLPSARPSIASVVKSLLGEAPLPPLPIEFSPSPPSRLSAHQSPRGATSCLSSSEDMV